MPMVNASFEYQPDGWGKAYRFLAVRHEKKPTPKEAGDPEQYELFDTPEYGSRVFVTNLKESIDLLVWSTSRGPERRT